MISGCEYTAPIVRLEPLGAVGGRTSDNKRRVFTPVVEGAQLF
jgi:hypothetical protein